MTKKELITKVLEDLGYNPQEDNDGDIMIRFQMKNIYFIIGEDEENYLTLNLPMIYEIEEDGETMALTICNKVTRELKLCKVYIEQTFKYVSANCEFFYTDEESLKNSIEHSLRILGIVRSVYRKTKKDFSD